MIYKGIIFDFNGVLLWDSHLQEKAWKQFSEKMRGAAFSDQEIRIHVHGRNNKHTLQYLMSKELDIAQIDELTAQKERVYKNMCLAEGDNFRLSPEAIELLSQLTRQNIPHTIATASGKSNLNFFIQHLDLQKWFDLDLIVYDDGTRAGKPAPDIYVEAAARLKLQPAHCMVVEDSHSGIEAAKQAGIGRVVALGPKENHELLQNLKGVHQVIQHLGEIKVSDFSE